MKDSERDICAGFSKVCTWERRRERGDRKRGDISITIATIHKNGNEETKVIEREAIDHST